MCTIIEFPTNPATAKPVQDLIKPAPAATKDQGLQAWRDSRDRNVLIEALRDMLHSAACDFIAGPGATLTDEAFIEILAQAEGKLLAEALHLAIPDTGAFAALALPTMAITAEAYNEQFALRARERQSQPPKDPNGPATA